ncbi:nucleotidyltransferase domain-containing protein [Deinococcus planocerae]|uniref:nucleotidyltransferase domain-containing protein n=1 Tax=Deinococcus planocerae TaxID=1737569 RepID=UPI000C7F3D46|nr:nucleotidyltransferase domain-containing protein [Deinococcus planocerae]
MSTDDRAQQIAAEYAALPEVLAVALGGSRAAGNRDGHSDLDLYVYSREEVPVAARRAVAERRGSRAEVDNRWWEPGDEWLERGDGLHVDVMFRRAADFDAHLTALLERHEARLGYTTALWHNLRTCEVLFDREGWLADLKWRADQPYPDGLARAIIALNFPLLRGAFGAYPNQIALAVRRGDLVAVNHRLTEFLASYFDVLFALNRTPHPGEKRLLTLAAGLPLVPEDFTGQVERLLALTPQTLGEVPGRVEALVDPLVGLLEVRGELPAPPEKTLPMP